jgi:hypothetical protein
VVTIFAMCALLRYWAGLYGEDDRIKIVNDADQLMHKASSMANQVAGTTWAYSYPSTGSKNDLSFLAFARGCCVSALCWIF